MIKFKRIYVEISNICNLNCPFCIKDKRSKRSMRLDEIKIVFEKIKPYTDYIYLHVKGEPLMHNDFSKILDLAYEYNLNVNITTNGTLIKKNINTLLNSKALRQINISLHELESIYMNDVIDLIKNNKNKYIQLRLWVNNELSNKNYQILNDNFNIIGNKVYENTFLSIEKEFIWPDIDNDYYNEVGTCLSGKMHLAILSNGIITPCCLDSSGIINLGNIFNDDLNTILNSKKYIDFIKGLNNNKLVEKLCQHCMYRK